MTMRALRKITRPTFPLLLIFLCACGKSPAPQNALQTPSYTLGQFSYGNCDPAIESDSGKSLLLLRGDGCVGIESGALSEINAFLAQFPKAAPLVQQQIAKKDSELPDKMKLVGAWVVRYSKLLKSVQAQPADKKAADLLREGNLEGSATQVDELLLHGSTDTVQTAANEYFRAELYALQSENLKALPLYEKAYTARSNDSEYAFAYAAALADANQLTKAADIYKRTLDGLHPGDRSIPQPELAANLRRFADLDAKLEQPGDAERYLNESLSSYRILAKSSPDLYTINLIETLDDMGDLYQSLERVKEAAQSCQEALTIAQSLAKSQPNGYQRVPTAALNRLAKLYSRGGQKKDAEAAAQQALAINRAAALLNPTVYQAHVVDTLNSLAALYTRSHQVEDAERALQEAQAICGDRVKDNAVIYEPRLASTLDNLGDVYFQTNRKKEAEKGLPGCSGHAQAVGGSKSVGLSTGGRRDTIQAGRPLHGDAAGQGRRARFPAVARDLPGTDSRQIQPNISLAPPWHLIS